jgi:signal transduction histidine kinase
VDRVTAQLNEFIHYSKPREPKPVPLRLPAVIQEARQALITDLEDKAIDLQMSIPDVIIEADEALLRQVLFNLLLNSIQAVPERGRISLTAKPENSAKLSLQVRDNGPGIAWEEREKIFAPYFTMRDGGTGLGLAVVKQIVLAHGWEIHLLPGREAGAVFEITGLRLSFKGLADV